jgi:hypothetical protein
MSTLRNPGLRLFAVAMLAAMPLSAGIAVPLHAEVRRCTLVPGGTLAVVRVEKDTMLSFAPAGAQAMSLSGVRQGPQDSLLATAETLMPAARVRILELDSTTRVTLRGQGVGDAEPLAFIRAAPYRADCRTIRWTDTVPFVEPGEVGYMRATLAPREQWIDGVPVLVIPDAWNYLYPRRRSLAYGAPAGAPLAPAAALFGLTDILQMPRATSEAVRIAADSAKRARAITWARANLTSADLEPVRTLVRRAILDPDFEVAARIPSRLRGTYRVDLEVGGERGTWFFRTHDRPGYGWHGGDSLQSTSALLASPHTPGYRLVGYAAGARDSVPIAPPRGPIRAPLVWLATSDRPTTPGNDARRALPTVFEFNLGAVPENLWNDVELLAPRMSATDSATWVRLGISVPRGQKQPRIPLTLRVNSAGGISADTTLIVGGRTLRVLLERVDTLSMKRPF